MKTDYQSLLVEYASEAYLIENKIILKSEWGNTQRAEKYLKKYWLPDAEYNQVWAPIQNKIFSNYDNSLSGLLFDKQFELLAIRGGCLFLEEDFNQLKNCFLKASDKFFVIIENTFGGKLDTTPFRMKYPIETTWEELISGNYISSALVDNSMKEYFVFGDSETWGKYSASDYYLPLDIIGFKPELASVFREQFRRPKEEIDEMQEWIPSNYKDLIKW